MEKGEKYFEENNNNTIDYRYFVRNNLKDDAQVLSNIQTFITTQVKDILLLEIKEDKFSLTKKELEKVPPEIRNYLRFSEHRGIKMYIFNTHDGGFKKAIAVFGGSIGRANEYYFDQIINDENYQNITKKTSLLLSEILSHRKT